MTYSLLRERTSPASWRLRAARLAPVLLGLCALLPGPAVRRADAQGAPPDEMQQIEQVQKDITVEKDALMPLLTQLKALSETYSAEKDLDKSSAKRDPLRREIQSRCDRIRELLDEFKALRKQFQFRRGSMLISQFLSGGNEPQVEVGLKDIFKLDEYPRELDEPLGAARIALDQDAAAFSAAMTARKVARQRITLAAAGGAALCVLLLVVFSTRQRRPPETVVGVPVRPPLQGPITQPAIARSGSVPPLATPTPRPVLAGPGTSAATPVPDAMLGGNYRIVKELSKGSLGLAYEAVDLTTQKKVVIKRLRDEFHRTEKDLDRLLAQARLAAALKHPNLAEVLSVFIEAERVHIAIERVQGLPLSKFLDPGNRIALPSIKRVLRQVAAVLEHAHSKQLLHGDLKPSNILVTQDGLVKVSDFGIGLEARKMAAKLSWAEPVGSPAYMAPEQELGTILKESDIYSLGVVLYEMVTGRLPFEGPNFLAQKREMLYQPPSRLARGPKEVDLVIQRALQPEPQRRFHSAAEFVKAMDTVPDGPPGPAGPAGSAGPHAGPPAAPPPKPA
jgi:hypothetical protein